MLIANKSNEISNGIFKQGYCLGLCTVFLTIITPQPTLASTWDHQYETIWHLSDFWPGEYPPRFSVMKDGVDLPCRPEMKLTVAKSAKCPVPKYATFSPWNNVRNKADDLLYRTVSKVTSVTITGDVKAAALRETGGADVTLELKKGETLEFLVYQAEGFALYRYKGEKYVMSEGHFQGKATFEKDPRKDDLWLRLADASGGQAWVLYDDAIKIDGIAVTEIEGYGIANDLPDPDKLSLKGVNFQSASIKLTEASKKILDHLAIKLRQVGDVKYEVAGYTDSSGNSASNLKLSQLRAEAIVDYLVKFRGVDAAKLSAVGYGDANPIADNATPEGRTLNRRVELNLL